MIWKTRSHIDAWKSQPTRSRKRAKTWPFAESCGSGGISRRFQRHHLIVSTGASVSQRNVIILSSRGLFREGIKRLLADVADVSLATSRAEVQDLLRDQSIDTVIVDQQDTPAAYGDLIWQLLSWPGMRVITVGLDMTDIQIYQHQQVIQASPEALIAAVVQ